MLGQIKRKEKLKERMELGNSQTTHCGKPDKHQNIAGEPKEGGIKVQEIFKGFVLSLIQEQSSPPSPPSVATSSNLRLLSPFI